MRIDITLGIRKMSDSCFVMVPFKAPFDLYYEKLIEPAVRQTGLRPLRGDSIFRPSPIVGDIWEMIVDAKVLIADLTEKNPNVFYELGLAHAIGKPVILIADDIGDVPFDLQSLRVILYDKTHPSWGDVLKSSLRAALTEVIENPIASVPDMFRKTVPSQAPVPKR